MGNYFLDTQYYYNKPQFNLYYLKKCSCKTYLSMDNQQRYGGLEKKSYFR